ncbi:MAG: ankyrin repeat domain-containing protein, partial [Streptosporangiaceae bacterium]
MSSEALPSRPSLDQLRRRAKELRDAARSGGPVALGRITARTPAATRGTVTLAAAQLAIAREHGYPSWPQLVAEVEARTAELGQRADEFLVASIRDWTGRATRMLARDPWLAGYDFRTAAILGDSARVGEMLARDPGLATRLDPRTGWTALHAACASRWHRLDPARAGGLTEVARLLLEAGADPNRLLDSGLLGESRAQSPPVPPLSAAIEMQAGPELTGLLLEYGAAPDVPGWHGRTPYQQAVRTGQDQVADLLARHGAST